MLMAIMSVITTKCRHNDIQQRKSLPLYLHFAKGTPFDLSYATNKISKIMIVTKAYPVNRTLTNVFDELFNSLPSAQGNDVRTNTTVPVNISENDNGYNIEFNAPGRNKEDFKINVDNGLVTVSYEKKEETE